VINGRSDVSPETRRRVETAIREHGYRRSPSARPRTPLLEVIFHELESEWALEIVRGVERVAGQHHLAVVLSGMLAGLGGGYLALDQHQFTDGMTAGRGFIALAATIFGRWDPVRAGLACLLFAAAETFQIQLQGSQALPSQFVEMIPYVLTIVALAGVVGRAVAPAALGKTTIE